MQSTCVATVVAEYDLLEADTPTSAIEAYFRKPLATWDQQNLQPGELEAVQRAFVRSTETRTIEIDREEHVVWITYVVSVEMEYTPRSLEYFGTTLNEVLLNGLHVTFPLDERVVELAGENGTVSAL
jgi:hypothetical protein